MTVSRFSAILALALPSCAILPPRVPSDDLPHVIHEASPPPSGTQKWNPIWWLGNADDPEPPDWYRPGKRFRGVQWQLRNPFHNLTFYVIGVKDSDFIRYGRDPGAVFRSDGGWNWCVIQKGWWRLPFVSYEGERMKFYALWREHGNFGLKLNLKRKEAGRVPQGAPLIDEASAGSDEKRLEMPGGRTPHSG